MYYTVEPPNKGHFGSGEFVLYWEAVLWQEVRLTSNRCSVLYVEVILWWEGPYIYDIVIVICQ